MVNTKIRMIMFLAGEDGEALYSQQKEDWKLEVAPCNYPVTLDYCE